MSPDVIFSLLPCDIVQIAVNLRKQRFTAGALRLDQVKLQFALDKDSGLPCGYGVYQQKDSNRWLSSPCVGASIPHNIGIIASSVGL